MKTYLGPMQAAPAPTPAATTVLVVEDDDALAAAMVRQLQRVGCDVERAATVGHGWHMVCNRRPDVVFCDISLPGVEGWELIDAIRDTADLAHIDIVVVTGKTDDHTRHRAAVKGCRYMAKHELGRGASPLRLWGAPAA
jgi:two-component system CheB/CheR fusion protein